MKPDLNPFFFPGGEIGCLLIHGGTGCPAEMRGMGEYLAGRGLTVFGPRLPGHGTTPEDLATVTWRDLISSAHDGYAKLDETCRQVFVAGLSLGGLITLYLASSLPLPGAIVMSSPGPMRDWRLRLLPLIKLFVKWFHSSGELDLTDPSAAERIYFYRRIPVSFGELFVHLQRDVFGRLERVTVPLLFMQGDHDRTIPPNSAQYLFDRAGSRDKRILRFSNSGHTLTVDSERQQVWAAAHDFIMQHSS